MAARPIENARYARTGIKNTFDEFFTHVYLPHAKTRKRSWKIDERLARDHVSAFFGSRRIESILVSEVESWLVGLRARGLAPATCNRILALLKSAFSLAETFGHIPPGASPLRQIRPLKVRPRREKFLSRKEGQALMRHLRQDDSLQSKAIQLLMLTGARKSEILNARWENLECERRILTVPVAKSGRPRHIYLSEKAVGVFRSIGRKEGSPWVFPGQKNGKPLSSLYHFWDKTRRTLGLSGVRLHDLRHSYASYLVASGHTLYEVQQLLGHADPRTTMRYAHFANTTLIKATASVAQILTEKPIRALKKKKTACRRGIVDSRIRCAARRRERRQPERRRFLTGSCTDS